MHRQAGAEWTGFADGETTTWKRNMFIIEYNREVGYCTLINNEVGKVYGI